MDNRSSFATLFSPVEIAGLRLKNRIVMPPMATAMQIGSDQFRVWYETRAEGGVGLIIMEALWASRLLNDGYCDQLQPTVTAIRERGVPVVLQLFQPDVGPEGEAIAPSATGGAREPGARELDEMVEVFAEASWRCQQMGFDGVEPHGAHGFFLNRMFSPVHNFRQDRFGGTPERRMALGLATASAIRSRVGPGYPVFWRHTMEEPQGYNPEDSIAYLAQLIKAGVDVLDISPSTTDLPPRHSGAVVRTGRDQTIECVLDDDHCNLAAMVKGGLDVPVVAVGEMEAPEKAEAALTSGRCDLCAVGRQLIADAQWPNKVREGKLGTVIHCTKCNVKCFGNLRQGIPIGCEENPSSGREYRHRT